MSLYFTLNAMKETKLGAVVNNGRGGGVVRESFSIKSVIEAEMPHLPIAQAWEFPSDLPSHPHILSSESLSDLGPLHSLSLPSLRPSTFLMEIIRLLLWLDPSLPPFLSSFFPLPVTCCFTSSNTLRTLKGPHMLCSL